MKFKLLVVGCVITSLTACGIDLFKQSHGDRIPDAVGKLETKFIDGSSTSCYGTLIDSSTVLSLNHCISNKVVSEMTFYPGGNHNPISLIPPSEITYSISNLTDFPKDVSVFLTMSPNRDVVPISILDTSKDKNKLKLDYADTPPQEITSTTWQHCDFETKSYVPGAFISHECHTPEGTSGRPFLEWKNDKWWITGIYHGYLKVKNKEGEIVTQGVATTPSSWDSSILD